MVAEEGLNDGDGARRVPGRRLALPEPRGGGQQALPRRLQRPAQDAPLGGRMHERRQPRRGVARGRAGAAAGQRQLVAHELRCVGQLRRVQGGDRKEDVVANPRRGGALLALGRPQQGQEVLLFDVVVHKLLELLREAPGGRGALLPGALRRLGGPLQQHSDNAQQHGDLLLALLGAVTHAGPVGIPQAHVEERCGQLDPVGRCNDVLGVRQQREQSQRMACEHVDAPPDLLRDVRLEKRRRDQLREALRNELWGRLGLCACLGRLL
mmetsp:Transcript_85200/g.264733  ORF Transcript_85200/g.264733 Transcript_85200/m.264733 type:complete len:267 (-) Transcript_85200:1633-2433(-)